MLHSVNQLKLNQTWKLSAKKNYNTSIQAKLPPLWRVSNTISLLLQLNFPHKQLVWKLKKKNQLIDIRHTRQKRYWYILSWTVWTGAPYFWFCSLALKPWKLSWIFTHLVPSERSLQKKNNTCRSSNHFKGFSFNSHWNYNKICVWNIVLFSGLWPWTFSLLVTFNKVFQFSPKAIFL